MDAAPRITIGVAGVSCYWRTRRPMAFRREDGIENFEVQGVEVAVAGLSPEHQFSGRPLGQLDARLVAQTATFACFVGVMSSRWKAKAPSSDHPWGSASSPMRIISSSFRLTSATTLGYVMSPAGS